MIKNDISKLLSYIEKHKYYGYDPYDIKETDWYLKINNKHLKDIFDNLNNDFAKELRDIFNIKPQLNNKALALFGLAYLNLYEKTLQKIYLKKAIEISKLLLKQANYNFKGICWGYPFKWKSGNYLFEKNTPSIVVTVNVGKFFLKLYKISKNPKYLKICKSITKFIIKNLHITKYKNNICFSYTPFDTYQIHNANLMGAEFLSEIGRILHNQKLLLIARKATYFTINQQNKDGSIYYYAKNSSKIAPTHLDIYHSGFEIRSLVRLYENLKDFKIKNAFLKYLRFFIYQYIINYCIPKLGPKIKNYETDIVDIHGFSEALLTLTFTQKYKNNKLLIKKIYKWGTKNIKNSNGSFKYRWIRKNNETKTIDIAYMRWGQAWSFYALTKVYKDLNAN